MTDAVVLLGRVSAGFQIPIFHIPYTSTMGGCDIKTEGTKETRRMEKNEEVMQRGKKGKY